ncbi:MAG: hypothetical protein FWF50_07425 [Defluviitaleaceae bacterium]|nr:hypothetical protein [Defluviitaleaceae bacterium]
MTNKKFVKKLTIALLAFAMMPVAAFAEETYYYEENNAVQVEETEEGGVSVAVTSEEIEEEEATAGYTSLELLEEFFYEKGAIITEENGVFNVTFAVDEDFDFSELELPELFALIEDDAYEIEDGYITFILERIYLEIEAITEETTTPVVVYVPAVPLSEEVLAMNRIELRRAYFRGIINQREFNSAMRVLLSSSSLTVQQ